MKRNLSIAEKRHAKVIMNHAICKAEKGKITIAEYREIEEILITIFQDRETTTTICKGIVDFLKPYGVHTEPHGIGWILSWI